MSRRKGKRKFRLVGRFWIEGPQGTFLGRGRVRLLEAIREHGSISAAARSMNMSYRKAWQLVDAINSQSPTPIVIKSTGGRGGGGSELTRQGEKMIELFWNAYLDFERFIDAKNQSFGMQRAGLLDDG